jgi:hypothetical protein
MLMRAKTFSDVPAESAVSEEDEQPMAPEYTFDGFVVDSSRKIVLTPVSAEESGGTPV